MYQVEEKDDLVICRIPVREKSLIDKKLSFLCLTRQGVYLEKINETQKTESMYFLPFKDILGVKLESQMKSQSNFFSMVEFLSSFNLSASSSTELALFEEKQLSIVFHTFSNAMKGFNPPFWIQKDFCFVSHSSQEQLAFFFESLKKLLYENENLPKRPRKLLVIINPIGGHGQGSKIYAQSAKPIFKLAEIDLVEIETQRSNHAYDLAFRCNLDKIDGIVCVGGDGIIYEVLNGLMSRPDFERAISIPIGIIPAGSSNALAVSSNQNSDPIDHAIHIAKGTKKKLDVVRVHLEKLDKYVYYTVCTSLGYLGEVSAEAVNYRWMGPFRYFYCGGKQVLQPNFYKIKLSYLPAECDEIVDPYSFDKLPISSNWKTIEVEVFCLMVCNVSASNTQFPSGPAPNALLTDGCVSLVIWKKCNFMEMMNYIVQQGKGLHGKLDYVTIFKVRALRFESLGKGSPTNIDGEVYPDTNMSFRVLPSLVTLFG